MEIKYIFMMVKLMLNKKGFTLIETLLVISVITILSSISLFYHQPRINDEDIVQKISNVFYKAKMNSIINKEKTFITVKNNSIKYYSDSFSDSIVLPGNIICKNKTFSYNANGNIYKASTLSYNINGSSYDFVFQVGSGSFEIR